MSVLVPKKQPLFIGPLLTSDREVAAKPKCPPGSKSQLQLTWCKGVQKGRHHRSENDSLQREEVSEEPAGRRIKQRMRWQRATTMMEQGGRKSSEVHAHRENMMLPPASRRDRRRPPTNKSEALKRRDAESGCGSEAILRRGRGGDVSGMRKQMVTHTGRERSLA